MKHRVFKESDTTEVSSVQFRCSVVSDTLWPHEPQHARPPCPSLTPGVHSNSCPSSQWCHPAISSSGIPFSSCPQSLPASGSFHFTGSLWGLSWVYMWKGWRTGPEYTRNQHLDVRKCGKNYATKRIWLGAAADTGHWMPATELIAYFTLPWCHLLAIQCPSGHNWLL